MRLRCTSTDLAKSAYRAYAASVDNTSVRGEPLPEWDALTTPVQNAWKLAAEAVRHDIELCDN